MNFQGFNVTTPHKVAILPLLDKVADDARLIGAVNTVWRDGDRFIGENTDGKGFMRSLRDDAGINPASKRIVCLGAGGARKSDLHRISPCRRGSYTCCEQNPRKRRNAHRKS